MKTRMSFPLAALLGLWALCAPGAAMAQDPILIKLGTLAPVGSPWHVLLKEAEQKWTRISGGRVKLKIFAGGTMGNEGDMIKKMRYGQLQAAALTTIGLHEITPEPMALDLPLFISSREERDFILSRIGDKLEAAVAKKGFVVLNWSEVGFTHFFSTVPRSTLGKMREGKLFVWDGDPASADAWKAAGFHPVVLSSTDIIPSMQTGLIDLVPYPPTVALSTRLHDKAPFMTDLVWSSLTGSLIVNKKTWESIPADLRSQMMEVARDLGRRTVDKSTAMEADALATMKGQGLKVVHVTDAPEWNKVVEETYKVIRGKVVPAGIFDEVYGLVKQYRAEHR